MIIIAVYTVLHLLYNFMPFRGKLELQNWLLEEKRFVLHVCPPVLYARTKSYVTLSYPRSKGKASV